MLYRVFLVLITWLLIVALLPAAAQSQTTTLLQPDNFEYLGAFRLPADPEGMGWEYGGGAMTYYPEGDALGPDDGFVGSLLATGHDWYTYVGEISIPTPVISADKNVEDLPVATTLQEFQDIRGGLFDFLDFEIPRVGLEYLPAQGDQETGKLYFAWGQHYQEDGQVVSHGWAELDLANPQTAGAWYLGDYSNYSTNDYIFAIPSEWAAINTPEMSLATGRHRDGGWSGQGPSLFAYGVPSDPPPAETQLEAVPLLLYGSTLDGGSPNTMTDYHYSDEWMGGAWLTAGEKSAVIFVGTKGVGEYWYGFANGVVWPDEPPFPEIPPYPNDDRGWWSTSFEGQFIFYNPDDFAAVANGEMETYEPQPYAILNVDEVLFNIQSEQQKFHLGAAAFDRERGYLYVFELFADEDRPIVHVWRVG